MNKNPMEDPNVKLSVIVDQLHATADTISGFQSLLYEIDKEMLAGFQDTAYNVMSHLTASLNAEIDKISAMLKEGACMVMPQTSPPDHARMQ